MEKQENLVENLDEYQTKQLERKLVKILDYRLLIWSFFGYFANGLDRNNMPMAEANGLSDDLGLVNDQYNWAVTMFFIGYVIFQVPMNGIITKVRPSIMLPAIMFLWGAIVCFMALVSDYRGLYGLRILLGVFESGFYPGIVYLLGSWYTKEELGARTAVFVAGSQVSGAFSGIISGAIAQTLHNVNGMGGWKWLFIIEGLIAVFVSLFGFFILPDLPTNTKFITGDMRDIAIKRLERQGKQTRASGLNWVTFRNLITSPYLIVYIIVFSIMQIGMGALQQFPIILKRMGYSSVDASYYQISVWILAGFVIIGQGYLSDWKGARVWHIVGGALWSLIWYVVMVAVNGGNLPIPLLFVAVHMTTPILGISPIMMTWVNEFYSCDVETRALAIALVNAIGNLAPNFANVKVWAIMEAPEFHTGKVVTMSLLAVLIVLVIAMHACQRAGWFIPQSARKIETESIDKHNDIEA
ncbi:major facilitator superfamily domain-containing protein [Cunninghamella echinulata]|nr:major facilitator superfamily domain-containing protein [Cunninghamella echinulata]